MVETLFPLTIKNACVRKRGKTIIGPMDLTLDESGFTVILGPNGAGKTTLLRLMHGLEFARDGSVDWAIAKHDAVKRQSFVFQTPVTMRRSVIENLRYPLKIRGIKQDESLQMAKAAAAQIGLAGAGELNAQLLSGGEKQKLAIARAMITRPDVLFLDEPTTNLDGRSTREIEEMLATARSLGTSIIMTTHDLGQAKRLAGDIVFLYRGSLHEQASAKSFFAGPQTPEARAYLTGDILE